MTSTSHISASVDNFRLAQRLVKTFSDEYKHSFDEMWSKVCSNSVEKLERKFRARRHNAWKKLGVSGAKSSFIYFCEEVRPSVVKKNPTLKVTQISAEMGKMWKEVKKDAKLLKKYNDLAAKDRLRYNAEKSAAEEKLKSEQPETTEEETTTVVVEKTKPVKPATTKTTKSKPVEGSLKVFKKQMRDSVKGKHPKEKASDINKRLETMWEKLSASKKAKYVVEASA